MQITKPNVPRKPTSTNVRAIFQIRISAVRHICHPNGGSRNPVEAKRLKAEGVLAGVADLTILLPQGRSVYIEMKVKGNRQTDNQKAFQQKAEALGYKYYVCYSFDQFKAIIEEELNTTDN